MGLAGPRKRRKISSDPNNTNWARSQGFGHNVLLSQGWNPGEGLGRTTTSYGDGQPRSSANAVKAVLREDNLGLGAKSGSDRNHGLDILQGVLGRLNGKSNEALEKEEAARRNVQCALYAEQRWGSLRFVSGGTLTGTTSITLESTPLAEILGTNTEKSMDSTKAQDRDRSSSADTSSDAVEKPEREDRNNESESKTKKKKKSKHSSRAKEISEELDPDEKAARKAARRERKRLKAERRLKESATTSEWEEPDAVPAKTVAPAPQRVPQSSRFHVRQRYIQQKRMAMMDSTALKEILLGQS